MISAFRILIAAAVLSAQFHAAAQVLYSFSSSAWYLLNDARRVVEADGTTSAALTYSTTNSGGQFWMSNPIFADAGWQVSFSFRITDSSNPSADGICFVVQAAGLQAGGRGGGIGYAGVGTSVAVCIDTYSSTSPQVFNTEMWTNGNVPQYSGSSTSLSSLPLTDWNWHSCNIQYDGTYMTWDVDGITTRRYLGNIRQYVGYSPVYWGFTSATGGSYAVHWLREPRFAPICTPPSPGNLGPQYTVTAVPNRVDAWIVSCAPGYIGGSPTTLVADPGTCSMQGSPPVCYLPSPTRTSTASYSPTGSRTSSSSATVSVTGSNSPTSTATRSVTASGSITRTASQSGSSTNSGTGSDTSSSSSTASSTGTRTASGSISSTASLSSTGSMTGSRTNSATGSFTALPTTSSSLTASPTVTSSITASESRSPSGSRSAGSTASTTPSNTASNSGTRTPSSSETSTGSSTVTSSGTASPTASLTRSPSLTRTATSSNSASATITSSSTSTASVTGTTTSSLSSSPTVTGTASTSPTLTTTSTSSKSVGASSSQTASISLSSSQTASQSATRSSTRSITASASSSRTATRSMGASVSSSQSASVTSSATASSSSSSSETASSSDTCTGTGSQSPSATLSGSGTSSSSQTASESASVSPSASLSLAAGALGGVAGIGAGSDANGTAIIVTDESTSGVVVMAGAGVGALVAILAALCCLWWFLLLPARRRKAEAMARRKKLSRPTAFARSARNLGGKDKKRGGLAGALELTTPGKPSEDPTAAGSLGKRPGTGGARSAFGPSGLFEQMNPALLKAKRPSMAVSAGAATPAVAARAPRMTMALSSYKRSVAAFKPTGTAAATGGGGRKSLATWATDDAEAADPAVDSTYDEAEAVAAGDADATGSYDYSGYEGYDEHGNYIGDSTNYDYSGYEGGYDAPAEDYQDEDAPLDDDADADDYMDEDEAIVGIAGTKVAGKKVTGGGYLSRKAKKAAPAASLAPLPEPKKLVIGKGTLVSEKVETQVIKLRRVSKIKGDSTLTEMRKQSSRISRASAAVTPGFGPTAAGSSRNLIDSSGLAPYTFAATVARFKVKADTARAAAAAAAAAKRGSVAAKRTSVAGPRASVASPAAHYADSGVLANGYDSTGAYATGEYADGGYAAGEYADGDYAAGEYADGGYAAGEYADEGYAAGEYADEGYAAGEYADGGYAAGEYADGGYAAGEYADGEYAAGEYADGEYAAGEYADGEYAAGEYADGEYHISEGTTGQGTT